MIINNNVSALNSYRNLNQNQFHSSKVLEKLSSGLRINRAVDDAAGLAISEKMKGQIRGLNQASRNILDGISLTQTADGGLQEVQNKLQRIRELTLQASNDTLTTPDREYIQEEIDQLKKGINDIANQTHFNGIYLLNRSGDSYIEERIVRTIETDYTIMVPVTTIVTETFIEEVLSETISDIDLSTIEKVILHEQTTGIPDEFEIPLEQLINGETFTFTTQANENYEVYIDLDQNAIIVDKFNHPTFMHLSFIDIVGVDGYDRIEGDIVSYLGQIRNTESLKRPEGHVSFTSGHNGTGFTQLTVKFHGVNQEVIELERKVQREVTTEVEQQVTETVQTVEIIRRPANEPVILQVGANEDQNFIVNVVDVRTRALEIDHLSVLTSETATDAIEKLDQAIASVSTKRSSFGSYQNALEHILSNVTNSHENLTSANSRIRDADMALKMTEFTKRNILTQSATAMLAQSNQLPQGILQLLS
ncbi:hypothetical protein BKP45_03110 [Anaerobacillus alkalidiazotrophicus]|uniref:Flagellin n=1 Tax=Anaerobacillus alkalidiazotrophicus TaxID=472963 RepID=A0A1S2MB22_9BACI|nr:flagellin [Anaerobacillus alkalidiazotrophicus]OIJ21703.1 hypothetical protein BKP45_03110 [Anaerobacillus alkalidiazotrophicus]